MFPIAMFTGGPWDIAIIAGVVVLLFGGSKMAGLGKSLGESIKEFKKATHDDEAPLIPPPAVTPAPPTAAVVTKPEEK